MKKLQWLFQPEKRVSVMNWSKVVHGQNYPEIDLIAPTKSLNFTTLQLRGTIFDNNKFSISRQTKSIINDPECISGRRSRLVERFIATDQTIYSA